MNKGLLLVYYVNDTIMNIGIYLSDVMAIFYFDIAIVIGLTY